MQYRSPNGLQKTACCINIDPNPCYAQCIHSLFFLLMAVTSKAQYQDAIVGKWLSADGDGKVEIYKKGDKYTTVN